MPSSITHARYSRVLPYLFVLALRLLSAAHASCTLGGEILPKLSGDTLLFFAIILKLQFEAT